MITDETLYLRGMGRYTTWTFRAGARFSKTRNFSGDKNLFVSSIGNSRKYHNTLCLSPRILRKHCSSFSWDFQWSNCGIIDHNLTDNNLNQHVNNTNASTNDILSNVTHNASTSTATRKRSRRKTKPANIHLDHSSVIHLSSCSLSTDEISILSRGLAFCPTPRHINWPEVSADIYDFSRRMRLAEYFFDENSNTRTANEHDTPFHNKSTWNPPPTTETEPLTPF